MSQTVDRADLVRRVTEILPTIRENALWQERHGRLHPETVEALVGAGVLRMRVPARYGGYECDTRTIDAVGRLLGSADGSTAFTVALWWISGFVIGMFPDEAQDEIFADPDVRVCGTMNPTAMAIRKDDGIVVSGRWTFNTGAAHSSWKNLAALLPTDDGSMEPVMALVPTSSVELDDDWDAAGLAGTGSVTAHAEDLFVPDARWVRIIPLLGQQYRSVQNAGSPTYRAPMVSTISAMTMGKIVGMGRGAQRAFLDRLPGRAISYTEYTSQSEAPITHLNVGEAEFLLQEAEHHAERLVGMVDEKAAADEPWSMLERTYARTAVGRACQLVKEAVDIYAMASGATSIDRSQPIQRFQRDVQALTLHGLNLPSTNLETYGRVLCGLAPNTTFI